MRTIAKLVVRPLIEAHDIFMACVEHVARAAGWHHAQQREAKREAKQTRGRLHLWDEVAGWQRPSQPVMCLHCAALKSAANVDDACPGAPLRSRAKTIYGLD